MTCVRLHTLCLPRRPAPPSLATRHGACTGCAAAQRRVQEVVTRVLRDAGGGGDRLSLAAYRAALHDADLSNMVVEVPIELESRV